MAILLTIAVGAGMLASGSRAAGPVLPGPIVITAGSVSFEIARDERITRIHTAGGALPIATRESPVGSLIAREVREWSYGGISSQVVPAPNGRAVAYTATNGRIQTTETVYVLQPGRHIDLTRLVSRLPGVRNGFIAYWSGQRPEL